VCFRLVYEIRIAAYICTTAHAKRDVSCLFVET
jgi:hypothetical protein